MITKIAYRSKNTIMYHMHDWPSDLDNFTREQIQRQREQGGKVCVNMTLQISSSFTRKKREREGTY